MTNYNILGFGGVRFVFTPSGTAATFPYSFGQVRFKQEYTAIQNPNKKIFRRFDGYRVLCDVTLYSIEDNAYQQLQTLITLLNQAQAANSGLYIYPEYATTNDNNYRIDGMMLDSDFAIEDLTRVEGLQSITLSFYSEELLPTLPNWSNRGTDAWLDSAGGNIIDSDSNNINLIGG